MGQEDEAVWTRVCRADEVPANGMKAFAVGGTSVLIVHTGAEFDGCLLTCLEHTWQFDLKTGAPVGEAEEGLTGYRLREEGGAIYVALE